MAYWQGDRKVTVGYGNGSNFYHVCIGHIVSEEHPVSTWAGFAIFLFVVCSGGHPGNALKYPSVKPVSDRLLVPKLNGELYTDSTVEGCTYCQPITLLLVDLRCNECVTCVG